MRSNDPFVVFLDVLTLSTVAACFVLSSIHISFWRTLLVLVMFIVNHMMGVFICLLVIDDKRKLLHKWLDEAPTVSLYLLSIQLWPILYYLSKRKIK